MLVQFKPTSTTFEGTFSPYSANAFFAVVLLLSVLLGQHWTLFVLHNAFTLVEVAVAAGKPDRVRDPEGW